MIANEVAMSKLIYFIQLWGCCQEFLLSFYRSFKIELQDSSLESVAGCPSVNRLCITTLQNLQKSTKHKTGHIQGHHSGGKGSGEGGRGGGGGHFKIRVIA